MSIKRIEVPDIGTVTLQKKRGNRALRINIANNGQIKVTMPPWAPYKIALDFVSSKKDWIKVHKPPTQYLQHERRVGKAHQLVFVPSIKSTRPSSRLKDNQIRITLPAHLDPNSRQSQRTAHKAIERALTEEAAQLLPSRLQKLARQHNFTYKELRIKRLTSRWGSCDQNANITLNCYLMQLPWRLIDYVLLHELTHTKIMAHGPNFWNELDKSVSNLPDIRKEMREHRPSLYF